MARRPRYRLTDLPQHVVQRGNARQPIFFAAGDQQRYLGCAHQAAREEGALIHAYALMGNHVHFLISQLELGAISRVMQAIGRQYVRFINDRDGRTGTLWDGRFKASVIQTDRYLANCHAYIELNPVRAGLVTCAEDYRWSSARHYLGMRHDPLVTECPSFRAAASDARGRVEVHRERLTLGLDDAQLASIRQAARRGSALGEDRFARDVDRRCGIARRAKPGRPRKATSVPPANIRV